MVGPPDSKNPPTASAAGAFPEPADLPLQPEADSLSTFVPEDAALEQSDSVPRSALTQAQAARVDMIPPDTYIVWPVDDNDRSWWSRLRSLKASWETKHLRRSARDEMMATDADMPGPAARPGEVTMEAITNLEKHLASLAALRDACASIDQRLARVEEEDRTLHELCKNIEARLGRTEDTIHRRDDIVAEWLEEFSAGMTARLQETEHTIQRIESERLDDTLRLTQQSIADSMLPGMCADIERQLVQARLVIERTEEIVADRTLHELCKSIDARLERTEDTVHRHEGIVTEWLQEFSADITARFAEAEEAVERIERIVSSRIVEQASSQQPSVRTDNWPVHAEETAHATSERSEPTDGGVLARAAVCLSRIVKIEYMNRPVQQPWVTRIAVPVLVLVAVVAIGALIKSNHERVPDKVVPLTTGDQISTPTEQATNQVTRAASTTVLMQDTSRSGGDAQGSPPQQRSPDRKPAPASSRSPRFVGTLSITSVPSGASVSINGKPAGRTPLRLPRQRAGSLAVQVAHDGFERWSAAVLVPADQLTQVTAKLRASAR